PAARQLFDFVLVDTAPLLITNDASELIPAADTVILLTRADHSALEDAHRASELLQLVDAPVLGAVVIQASDTPTAYSYYQDRYYTSADTPPRWWHRLPILKR